MTEAAPGCTVLDSADAERKVGSAGKPVFFTDVRVVRPDGTEAAADEVGEVVVSGPNIMAGYWNDPERTADGARRRLVPHRRRRLAGRRGLPLHPRPLQGHDHLRRRERVPGRDRVGAARAAGRRGGRGHRRARTRRWGEVGLAVVVAAPGAATRPGGAAARRCASGWPASRCPGTSGSPTTCPRPPPARSASPTCAPATPPPRRTPHEHHHAPWPSCPR